MEGTIAARKPCSGRIYIGFVSVKAKGKEAPLADLKETDKAGGRKSGTGRIPGMERIRGMTGITALRLRAFTPMLPVFWG